MCEKLTVDLALKRVREGVAGRDEANLLRAQIDKLVFMLRGLGIDASCIFEDKEHGG